MACITKIRLNSSNQNSKEDHHVVLTQIYLSVSLVHAHTHMHIHVHTDKCKCMLIASFTHTPLLLHQSEGNAIDSNRDRFVSGRWAWVN